MYSTFEVLNSEESLKFQDLAQVIRFFYKKILKIRLRKLIIDI